MSRDPTRDRIIDAALVCIDRDGLRSLTIEGVATEAGVGRATIYRHFSGGRQQLLRATVDRERSAFWDAVAGSVAPLEGLEAHLVGGLMAAHRMISEHRLLQQLLSTEPEELLPTLFASELRLNGQLRGYLLAMLQREALRDGVDVHEAADYLARMLLMHVGSRGCWDLTDEAQVQRLVRSQFLAGVLAERASDDP